MFKNIIAEIIHATGKVKSPQGDFEKLDVIDIETNTLKVKDKASVNNELKVDHILKVDEKATIKELEVTENATVDKKLRVKSKATFDSDVDAKGLTTVADIHITKVRGDSQAFGKTNKVRPLVTSAERYETPEQMRERLGVALENMKKNTSGNPDQPNVNDAGSEAEFSRIDHTHQLPEAIKNPAPVIIKNHDATKNITYDGSEKKELKINWVWAGASKENHYNRENTNGVGDRDGYGHLKLLTLSQSDVENIVNGNKVEGSDYGDSSGTALTPSSLTSLVKYTEQRYIHIPETAGDPVIIPRDMVVEGVTTFKNSAIFNSTLQLNQSVIIKGADAPSDNTMQIHGIGNENIAKIQFGNNKDTVLRSSNDGHLYIEHGDKPYVSKISDYEIEAIITPNANAKFRIWAPSKEGYYRIYLIGGGGLSGAAFANVANIDDGTSYAGPKNGYGNGHVYPGLGGGGGPVVIVDIVTANAEPASSNGLDKSYSGGSITGTVSGWGIVSLSAVTETDGVKYFTGTASIDKVSGGSVSSGDAGGSSLVEGSCTISFSNVAGNLTYTSSGSGDDITYTCTGGTISLSNVSATLRDCVISGNNSDTYEFTDITISSINITSGADTPSDDGSDDDITTDPKEEDEIGIRFVFLKKVPRRAANNLEKVTTRGETAFYRMVGIQNVSTVGKIINEIPWTDGVPRTFNGSDDNGIYKYYGTSAISGTDDNPSTKTDTFDALVGHGYDAWTANSTTVYHAAAGIETPLSNEFGNTRSTYINEVGDNTVNVMEGGTIHIEGMPGDVIQGDMILGDKSDTKTRKDSSVGYAGCYACQDGYAGGCPGSIGITGWVLSRISETNGSTDYGNVTSGKGSTGSVKTKTGFKVTSNQETILKCVGGYGGSFAIAELDGYSGSKQHSDTSSSSTQLVYPARKSPSGGYGYYGGGHGGGGGFIRRKSNTSNPSKVTGERQVQGANGTMKTNLPCAVIVYMGKQKR